VVDPLSPVSIFVSSVAHSPGSGGTQWRTDLAVVNHSAVASSLTLSYLPYASGSAAVVRSATLAAGAAVEWQDVMVSLFGVNTAASAKGSIKIVTTAPVVASARTYNQTSAGTFGQLYPGVPKGTGLTQGKFATIPQLAKSTAFRTNIGVLNNGLVDITVTIKLFGEDGAQVGASLPLKVEVGRYMQVDDAFTAAGAGLRPLGYAMVTLQTSGGQAWAYGSVVDNVTGDPTTVEMIVP
jgi:hypothetical protein